MYFDDMTVIGLVLTSFGAAMRDPVTMISAKSGIGWLSCSGGLLREGGHSGERKCRRDEYSLPYGAESQRARGAYSDITGRLSSSES